jgi:putative transposase
LPFFTRAKPRVTIKKSRAKSRATIMIKTEYQRNLPHFHHIGRSFFVTWRLHGSLPKEVIAAFKAERQAALDALKTEKLTPDEAILAELAIQNHYYLRFDDALDRSDTGPHHLKNHEMATTVIDKMKSYDGKYYTLEAYCVMSNHVHALFNFSIQLPEKEADFEEKNYVQLSKVMNLIKGGTGYTANKILGVKGSFWEKESFDRYIRNEEHRNIVVAYILNNPVKAGICKTWSDYPYSGGSTCFST